VDDDHRGVTIVLGSGSPRRRTLLACIVPGFAVETADVDESPVPGENPTTLAIRLAVAKAMAVAALRPDAVVIGADTVVALREREHDDFGIDRRRERTVGAPSWRILGKPGDADEARHFLRLLGGQRHVVITSVAIARPGGDTLSATAHSAVWLRPMSEAQIADYVASGQTMDKAGGYAIQDEGFRPVARIEGSETNVMGLPVGETRRLLASAGVADAAVGADSVEQPRAAEPKLSRPQDGAP
jgi:septum formation protein